VYSIVTGKQLKGSETMEKPQNLQNGQEQWENFSFRSNKRGSHKERIQYDYRTDNGKLFSCIAKSLEEARQKRDKWIETV